MLRFDTEHQRARKENMVIIYGVNWNISFYDRNLDFGDYGWHRLLWPEFRDRQLWSEAATIDEIELTMSMKPLLAFFFQQERIGWVVFASRAKKGSAGCHFDKERLTWYEKRNSSATR
jgi:hypothetical protein